MTSLIQWVDELPTVKTGKGASTGVPDLIRAAMGQVMQEPNRWAKVEPEITDGYPNPPVLANRIEQGNMLPGVWKAAVRQGVLYIMCIDPPC